MDAADLPLALLPVLRLFEAVALREPDEPPLRVALRPPPVFFVAALAAPFVDALEAALEPAFFAGALDEAPLALDLEAPPRLAAEPPRLAEDFEDAFLAAVFLLAVAFLAAAFFAAPFEAVFVAVLDAALVVPFFDAVFLAAAFVAPPFLEAVLEAVLFFAAAFFGAALEADLAVPPFFAAPFFAAAFFVAFAMF